MNLPDCLTDASRPLKAVRDRANLNEATLPNSAVRVAALLPSSSIVRAVLYLHFNLCKENANRILFWWFVSTVGHIGFGGTHENPVVQDLLKRSMKLYRDLKPFYQKGEFIGLEESAHLHILNDQKGGVLNLFNLSKELV